MAAAKKRSKKASKKTAKKASKKKVAKKSNHIPLEILEKRHARLGRIIKARHGHIATA